MAIPQAFGQRIRALRLAKILTQRELADQVGRRLKDEDRRGFDVTYLSKIENGRVLPPSVAAILQLAAVLEINSDELLALAGKVPPDVGEALKKSPGARAFYRSAANLGLSEKDWYGLLDRLKTQG
ncbi:MAG: helix-turn-helix transcriptional regulator [Planctomycetes bacterium]|nr:helix-turn-helix transcriptional regulator [Planctomycetota bacterium]